MNYGGDGQLVSFFILMQHNMNNDDGVGDTNSIRNIVLIVK